MEHAQPRQTIVSCCVGPLPVRARWGRVEGAGARGQWAARGFVWHTGVMRVPDAAWNVGKRAGETWRRAAASERAGDLVGRAFDRAAVHHVQMDFLQGLNAPLRNRGKHHLRCNVTGTVTRKCWAAIHPKASGVIGACIQH